MSLTCPTCGAPASGNFCSNCGNRLSPAECASCGTGLSPQARFCHHCGRPTGGVSGSPIQRSERTAWLVATALCVVLVGLVWYQMATRGVPAPVAPDMSNPGAQAQQAGPEGAATLGGSAPVGGPAPDISQMTPRERFDRLFNRIMEAAARGDTAEVARFTPMALGAYSQLDTFDADARYHAAVIRTQGGDLAGGLALADSILAQQPGHLFGYIIRGEVARVQRDTAALRRAQRDFLAHTDTELRAGRREYEDHRRVVEEFRKEAVSGER